MARRNRGVTRRERPNLLITGTPGTGKSTTASALAEATNLRYICIGDLVKEKEFYHGWDNELECHFINEDSVSFLLHPYPFILLISLSTKHFEPLLES